VTFPVFNTSGLDLEIHDQIVTSEVNKLIGDSLCTICRTGFLSQEERDEAVSVGKIGTRMTFAHSFCWDEKKCLAEKLRDLQEAFTKEAVRVKDKFAREIDKYARRKDEGLD
jgi:hypothetical protein